MDWKGHKGVFQKDSNDLFFELGGGYTGKHI